MEKTVLVSRAGSGIGQAVAVTLANSGCGTVLLGRNRQTLEETRSLLQTSAQHAIIVADIKDAQSIKAGLQNISPTLTGVVANAGVGGENRYGEGDRWQEIVDTNLTGTYQLVMESLPYFATDANEYRHIVIISSILARLGVPGYSAYCASKAGLLGLMRSWAVEFVAQKILVNAICPGWVSTQMATQGLETFAQNTGKSYDEIYQAQMEQVLLRKMSTPEEVAHLVEYLVSQTQTSITGQTLDINNGALMPS